MYFGEIHIWCWIMDILVMFVSLDTTYFINHANMPLSPFFDFIHHASSIIFGAVLLYDETTESFK